MLTTNSGLKAIIILMTNAYIYTNKVIFYKTFVLANLFNIMEAYILFPVVLYSSNGAPNAMEKNLESYHFISPRGYKDK